MAVLAVSAMMACSSEGESASALVNGLVPVPVDLSLQVSAVRQDTRTSAETTQNETGSFRGVSSVKLIPFTVAGREVQAGDEPLPVITVSGGDVYRATGETHYLNKTEELLTGTASFLAYAMANPVDDSGDPYLNGALTENYGDNSPGNITFSPVSITSAETAKQTAIAGYMTSIATAADWNQTDDSGLMTVFNEFANNKGGAYEAFAGSSANIIRQVNELYKRLDEGFAASTVRNAVLDAIKSTGYVEWDADNKKVTALKAGDYPTMLPDGSALLQWDNAAHRFNFQASQNHYSYPVPLCYFANSPISTANKSMDTAYSTTKTWTDILAGYTDGNTVESATRSVAVQQPLHYGVGCLKVLIKARPYSGNGLLDADMDYADLIPLGEGVFPLTAILVGGQNQQDYSLAPLYPDEDAAGYDATADPEYIIYDRSIAADGVCLGDFAGSSFSTPVYTLALQSKMNKSVKMVLEFLNNSGRDFNCESGVIRQGTKFYMVATIVSSMAMEEYQQRIFTKDYMTTAQLTIASLAKAYNALPDLNSDKIRLFTVVEAGISQWHDGKNDNHEVYNW